MSSYVPQHYLLAASSASGQPQSCQTSYIEQTSSPMTNLFEYFHSYRYWLLSVSVATNASESNHS